MEQADLEELKDVATGLDWFGASAVARNVRVAVTELSTLRDAAVQANAGAEELHRLSDAATPGEWHVDMFPVYDEDSGRELEPMCEGICIHTPDHEAESIFSCREEEARFIVALVNAYRAGRLIEAPRSPLPAPVSSNGDAA